jgi:hypothetical protein
MSALNLVLHRLDGLGCNPRDVGGGSYRASCPAHGGSNRTALAIREGDGERVLLRPHCGCEVEHVVSALGIEMRELFPPRPAPGGGHAPMKRRGLIRPSEALDVLDSEMTLAIVCAADMSQGKALDEATRDRLRLSAARVALIRDEARA